MNRSSPAMNVAQQTTMLTFARCDIRSSCFRVLLRRRSASRDLDTPPPAAGATASARRQSLQTSLQLGALD